MSDKLAGGTKAGAISVSLPVELLKSADSTPLTGIVFGGVTASYWRQGGVRVAITPATLGSVNAAWSSGGFVEVDATNMPGVYRLDVPDAAFATGADWVVVSLKVATAFQLSFFFALESVGAAELSARIPTALATNGEMKADTLRVSGTAQTARDLGAQLAVAVSTAPTAAANATAVRTELAVELARVDVATSTRNATTPPTVAAIRSEMDANSTKLANLDVAVSTRSTYAGADTAGTATLLTRLTAIRAALIDNLDAAISSVKAKTDNLPIDPADASDIAAALTTIAGYIDTEVAAIKAKTDNIPASPASEVTLAAVKAKTDLIPAAPAAVGDVPSAASVAGAVRTNLAVELARVDVAVSSVGGGSAPTAAAIADAVCDEVLSGHVTAGTVGAALIGAQAAGDPLSVIVPGSYAAHTVGAIIARLDLTETPGFVAVVPAAPDDLSLCRVYGYIETVDNKLAAGVEVKFELFYSGPIKSERIISGRIITAKTDSQGRLSDGTNPFIDLQRNSNLIPAGTKYRITCAAIGLSKDVTLAAESFDLASLIE